MSGKLRLFRKIRAYRSRIEIRKGNSQGGISLPVDQRREALGDAHEVYVFRDGVQAVEVLVEDEEDKVNAFLEIVMKRKPENADVEKIDIVEYVGAVMKTESYYRYLTSMQLSRIATYGGIMIEKQEETVEEVKGLKEEFRDYREEFRDYREEFRDYREEFRDYREEFRGFAGRTDENFRLISEKYGEISEGLKAVLEALIRESRETRERLADAMEMLAEAIRLLRGS